jgi:LPS-assembly protein
MRLPLPVSRCTSQHCCLAVLQCIAVWGMASSALAQTQADGALLLKPSTALAEEVTEAQRKEAPVFLRGEHISGRTDLETVVQGDAEMRKADTIIRADTLEYDQPTDQARATGNVRIYRGGNHYQGPLMELKVDSFEGFFVQPVYQFGKNGGHGEASRADFLDEAHTVVHDATYTTCRRTPGPSWMPDWVLKASSITLDNDEEEGLATGAYVLFKGVPVLPVPAIGFPLTDKRRSGFLPPTVGLDNVSGSTVSVPYYWNIAPNRDATITPTLMTARGVELAANMRYLEPSYNGRLFLDSMPEDKLRDTDRWGMVWQHNGTLHTGLPNVSPVALALNINRVSDNNYWRDFVSPEVALTQRLLPASVLANWTSGAASGAVQVLQWQTLQAADAPIVPPYDRVPQITARYAKNNVGGFDYSLDGDFTQFESDRGRTNQPNAQRSVAWAQVSRPVLVPAGYLIPKLQLHASAYQFDAALSNGSQYASSVVPTFSLDGGLVFERESTLFGSNYVQTLEPRVFYVNTPFVDQSLLPNYDTGLFDFNFASIYLENAFAGHDKISDNNLVTMGLTSRFLDPDTGNQYARLGLAQRVRFEEQRVTGGVPAQPGLSDVLLGAEVNLNERLMLDTTVQYNPLTEQSVRSTLGARYNPSPYRVVNAAYRLQRNVSEQIDVSWQWPINDLWGDRGQDLGAGQGQGEGRYYALGRMNYSLDQSKLVDMVLGVEYDAGCWLGRVVFSRLQTSTSTAVERWIFQLEFVGFTRIGTADPRTTLKQNISRYQNLRDAGAIGTSRFSNYE